MSLKTSCLKTRNIYINHMKEALLGPGAEGGVPSKEEEVLSTSGKGKYTVGLIYPKNENPDLNNNGDDNSADDINSEDYDNLLYSNDNLAQATVFSDSDKNVRSLISDNDDESSIEDTISDTVNTSTKHCPSAAGFTFFADKNILGLKTYISFAFYKRVTPEECIVKLSDSVTDFNFLQGKNLLLQYDEENNCKYLRLKVRGSDSSEKYDNAKKDLKSYIAELKALQAGDETKIAYYSVINALLNQLIHGEKRHPVKADFKIDFSPEKNVELINVREVGGINKVQVSAIKRIINNLYSYTIMLVNDSTFGETGSITIQQPEIRVETDMESDWCFKEYSPHINFDNLDDEEKTLSLLYRNKRNFSTGHGCAVDWNIDDNGKGYICSDFFPTSEVPQTDFERSDDFAIEDNQVLSMQYLANENFTKEEKVQKLGDFIEKYNSWISSIENKSKTLNENLKPVAEKNVELCKESCDRMKAGLNLLKTEKELWQAFCLANEAMLMQRIHIGNLPKKDCYPEEELNTKYDYFAEEYEQKHKWRTFQLAFLLMSVVSIFKDKNDGDEFNYKQDRNLVDLIWFPTGGGKTEAYLGLTAFTIFFRRLKYKDEESSGTTVIMRYTMRLLTTQQFLRASTLICACELIRLTKKNLKLGKKEITIGLWIGGEHTPNKVADAAAKIKALNEFSVHRNVNALDNVLEENSRFQILKCPWCGTKLEMGKVPDGVNNNGSIRYKVTGQFGYVEKRAVRGGLPRHIEIVCQNPRCAFSELKYDHLPISVVDEDLYNNPPTLLFGTVDKFAQLTWKKEPGKFFGVGMKARAPELIIQDELHLISGALGTMVGLYETIIDFLCRQKGSVPKIIASTATIRHAAEQCCGLYGREVRQFPSPGIDSEDSYFSLESKIDKDIDNIKNPKYGRTYIGLMSPKTRKMAEGRIIANLLQASKVIDVENDTVNTTEAISDYDVRDRFWTLLAYFNTTKELGSCRSMISDTVEASLKAMGLLMRKRRYIGAVEELTGHTDTAELIKTLDKLERTKLSEKNKEEKKYPVNMVLATNMISVGIDIARLNLMLLEGQPKTTSEYIQASSRVGRDTPGVVFVQLDSSRSRDRSHFETFKTYHESFYKYVEPTSVTPYSKPARERAIHAVVVAILRNIMPEELGDDKQAGEILNHMPEVQADIDRIKDFIVAREEYLSNINHLDSDKQAILSEIDNFIKDWHSIAGKAKNNNKELTYGENFQVTPPSQNQADRLLKAYEQPSRDVAIETLTSLRNVDKGVHAEILF